ncbi:Serine/threonine-protein kinase 4, partial [Coelomomyces lativittatus]
EVIQEVGYTTKADIWSLGITCIEMAEGHPPFHNIHPMKAIFLIPSQPPPRLTHQEKWSPPMHQFVSWCLTKDPDQRPTASTLLSHSTFVQSTNPTVMYQCVQRVLPRTPNETPRTSRPRRPSNASSIHSYMSDELSLPRSPQPPERPERNQHRRLGSTSSSRRPSLEFPTSANSTTSEEPPVSQQQQQQASRTTPPSRRASEDPNARLQRNVIAFDPREDSLRNLRKSNPPHSMPLDLTTPTSRMRSSSTQQSNEKEFVPRRHRSSSAQSNTFG